MAARFYRPSPSALFAAPGWRRRFEQLGERLRQKWRAATVACDDEALFRDRAERFTQYCQDCRDDTPHQGVGEVGLGWYAQICRCRRCGRHSVKIWTCW